MKPKRLSQAFIAKSLGISRATVSLVLRGGHGAAEETRSRVLAAATAMGYRPNALIHSIRSGKSRTVGSLVQPIDSYWRDVCGGIHDRLIEAEHLPLFLWNNIHLEGDSEEYALNQIHRLLDHWVDGVIFWPFFAGLYKQHLPEFQSRNIPMVAIHHVIDNVNADVVESDEAQIAALVVGHLAELGHREFLLITGPEGIHWSDSRSVPITQQLALVPGAVVRKLQIHPAARHYEAGTAAIIELLRAHPKTTAVIASVDKFAQHVYEAAAHLGLSIPDQLSVMGVADLDLASILAPKLTTVRQDGYSIGRRAAQVELERSAGLLMGPPRKFREPGSLVLRQSTAAPRAVR